MNAERVRQGDKKQDIDGWADIATYDSRRNKTNDIERAERLNSLAQDEVVFLRDNFVVTDGVLEERYAYLDAVEWDVDDVYAQDGTLAYTIRNTNAIICNESGNFEIPSGIHFPDNLSEHNLVHEMMHGLSSKVEIEFDENGNGYLKNGLQLVLMNREDGVIDQSFVATALNEGVTELLASKFCRENEDFNAKEYMQFRDLADILAGGKNTRLIQAYLSDNEQEVFAFWRDFEQTQGRCSARDLIGLSMDSSLIPEKVLNGCVDYALGKADNDAAERARIQRLMRTIQIRANHIHGSN